MSTLRIVAKNMALAPVRFHLLGFTRTVNSFGTHGLGRVTEMEAPDSTEPQQLYTTEIEWPYNVRPTQIIWKVAPGSGGLWQLMEMTFEGKSCIVAPGMLS